MGRFPVRAPSQGRGRSQRYDVPLQSTGHARPARGRAVRAGNQPIKHPGQHPKRYADPQSAPGCHRPDARTGRTCFARGGTLRPPDARSKTRASHPAQGDSHRVRRALRYQRGCRGWSGLWHASWGRQPRSQRGGCSLLVLGMKTGRCSFCLNRTSGTAAFLGRRMANEADWLGPVAAFGRLRQGRLLKR